MAKEKNPTQTSVRGRFLGGGIYEAREKMGKQKFSACVVLDDGEQEKIEAIRDAAIDANWPGKKPSGLQDWTLRFGDDEEFEHSYEQHFINPGSPSDKPPQTVWRNRSGVLEHYADIYPGCNVAVSVNAYSYKGDKKSGVKPGVTLSLRGIMFTSHGERIGDSFSADEFSDMDSEFDVEIDVDDLDSLL